MHKTQRMTFTGRRMSTSARTIHNVLRDYFTNRSNASIAERPADRKRLILGLERALREDLVRAGIDPTEIQPAESVPDTDAYRLHHRRWDLIVVLGGFPFVVIELKTAWLPLSLNKVLDELVAAAASMRAALDQPDSRAY